MNVIFLDMDGVLNNAGTFNEYRQPRIDPAAVERLNRLILHTGAKIVVSSTWRGRGTLEDAKRIAQQLKARGFLYPECVIGCTPDLYQPTGILALAPIRGVEITHWLEQHPEVEHYVILDDDDDMGSLVQRLVQTTFDNGLQDEHVERAIALLGADAEPPQEP